MTTIIDRVRRALAVTACALPFAAFATDGYFSHGYGMKGKGMAGAIDLARLGRLRGRQQPGQHGLRRQPPGPRPRPLQPARQAKRTGSGGGMLDFSVDSDSTLFSIPEFGYNTMHSSRLSLGVACTATAA